MGNERSFVGLPCITYLMNPHLISSRSRSPVHSLTEFVFVSKCAILDNEKSHVIDAREISSHQIWFSFGINN